MSTAVWGNESLWASGKLLIFLKTFKNIPEIKLSYGSLAVPDPLPLKSEKGLLSL